VSFEDPVCREAGGVLFWGAGGMKLEGGRKEAQVEQQGGGMDGRKKGKR
jgi:hypothetical protein